MKKIGLGIVFLLQAFGPGRGLVVSPLHGAGVASPTRQKAEARSEVVPVFLEVESERGLIFQHVHGGEGKKYLVETMGAGGGFLDFDNDGWPDVYLVQSGSHHTDRRFHNSLFRNDGDGSFTRVEASGAEDPGYGMGCTFADYDNDGWTDIYVTNFGPNRLFHNRGDGTFEDVSQQAGVADPGWSTSAAFADVDGDGWLDLYVANYLEFTYTTHVACGPREFPAYCHPSAYPAQPNSFYLNLKDGTFRKDSGGHGLVPDNTAASKSLGVLFFDLDEDGDQDLYVANDSTQNFLFENQGRGRFRDVSLLSGTGYNLDGKTEAGMGVDAGDIDGDGWLDLIVTNLDLETNTFYRNLGKGLFADQTERAGLGGPSRTLVGFGVNFADLNNSGALDVFVVNGHVEDTIQQQNPSLRYAQRNQVLLNLGGRFVDVSQKAGRALAREEVSRGSALADMDRDGDLDILVTNNNGPARLLLNRLNEKQEVSWVQFLLRGTHCNRDAVGSSLRLTTGTSVQVRQVRTASSYLSQSERVVHFGLGGTTSIRRLEIRWPCGRVQQIDSLQPNRRHEIVEPAPAEPQGESSD